jgi:putative transposase
MKPPLLHEQFYHIYNRGNNYENIFIDNNDYKYFLELYDIFIDTIADTYAWCLMKNHFHVLLRIRDKEEIGFFNSDNSNSVDIQLKWKTHFPKTVDLRFRNKPQPSEQFKHLFSSYTKYFNRKYNRKGSLFTKNFQRIPISNKKYYSNLIVYIHNNPVKHGFSEYAMDYPWSSYLTVISTKNTKLKRESVIEYFDDIENFKFMHRASLSENEKNLKDLALE